MPIKAHANRRKRQVPNPGGVGGLASGMYQLRLIGYEHEDFAILLRCVVVKPFDLTETAAIVWTENRTLDGLGIALNKVATDEPVPCTVETIDKDSFLIRAAWIDGESYRVFVPPALPEFVSQNGLWCMGISEVEEVRFP